MATIRLVDAETGMVLAADVRDRSGRLLLRSGMAIEPKHLTVMRSWGVVEIEIESAAGPVAEQPVALSQVPAEYLERARAIILPRFRHNPPNNAMLKELIEISVEYEALRLYRGDTGHG